jgi:hypothetical protein
MRTYTTTFPVRGKRRKVEVREMGPHEYEILCEDECNPASFLSDLEIAALINELRTEREEAEWPLH